MLVIDNILISDDILQEQFLCNLQACKGACCIEGDFGAPLEANEAEIIEDIYEHIAPLLSDQARSIISKEGFTKYYEDNETLGTPLLPNGACAYLTDESSTGIAKCAFEKAFEEGKISFRKPISCHLYPVRVTSRPNLGFEALNYDRWDICSAACTAGKKAQLFLFQFVKEALIRKYGEDFYAELEAAANHVDSSK